MKPRDTELLYWECLNCRSEQEIILIKTMDMPSGLICIDCGHKSGPVIWRFEDEKES